MIEVESPLLNKNAHRSWEILKIYGGGCVKADHRYNGHIEFGGYMTNEQNTTLEVIDGQQGLFLGADLAVIENEPYGVATKQEFKKHVAAIHTSGELSLLERKLVNVLLLNAYDNLRKTTQHRIPVKLLCSMLGWEESQDIPSLKRALKKIASTTIEFDILGDQTDQSKAKWSVGTLLAHAEIEKGMCTYEYSSNLAERLADPEIYAIINLSVQRLFKGSYSLTLYENCLRFRRVGTTGWINVNVLRRLLGADTPMYDQFKHFNNYAISKSVKEINEVSDLRLTTEFRRESKKVVDVKFRIEEKEQKSLFDAASTDAYDEYKQRDSFKRLLDLGIGEKLAIAWITQDEAKVISSLNYFEARDSKKSIKNAPGYIRRLIEDPDVSLGKSSYQIRKEAAAAAVQALKESSTKELDDQAGQAKDKSALVKQVIDQMELPEILAYVEQYAAEVGEEQVSSFNRSTGKFRASLQRVSFHGWIRDKLGNKA